MTTQELNDEFGISTKISFFTGKGGWSYAEINHEEAQAVISIYGAHVLHYIPKNGVDILWNTDRSFFQEGKAIRGGIPICWPWFGPHHTDSTKPAHGFARLSQWHVASTFLTHNGDIQLTLQLNSSVQTEELWPFDFSAIVTITVGKKLTVELAVTNTGIEDFIYTDALHSYLQVGEISKIVISGLQDTAYYDWTDNNVLKIQQDQFLTIQKEENRRYANTSSICIIEDPVFNRKIQIAKTGSNTTVVWNPWIETAKTFADMNGNDYKTMVCIEAANAFDETITLAPGKSHRLGTTLSLI